ERFDLQITELDPVAFAFQAHATLRPSAVVELARNGTVHPKCQGLAAGRYFEIVPFAGRFYTHVFDLFGQAEKLLLPVRGWSFAEQKTVFTVPELCLVPNRAIFGISHVGSAVVARLSFHLCITK